MCRHFSILLSDNGWQKAARYYCEIMHTNKCTFHFVIAVFIAFNWVFICCFIFILMAFSVYFFLLLSFICIYHLAKIIFKPIFILDRLKWKTACTLYSNTEVFASTSKDDNLEDALADCLPTKKFAMIVRAAHSLSSAWILFLSLSLLVLVYIAANIYENSFKQCTN